MRQDARSLAEVVACLFKPVGSCPVQRVCELGVQRGEVKEDVREFEAKIILRYYDS